MVNILFWILAYLCGSVNFAIILCKLARLPDPRQQGSGNPGATNVLRFGGKKLAIWVIIGDALKGFVPVAFASAFGLGGNALALVAVAAVLGHMFPIFFRFQGGKGIATILGAIVGLSWLIGVMVIVTWLVIAAVTRYSSLASIISVIALPFYTYFFSDPRYVWALSALALIILYRHRGNMSRLLHRTEPKIGRKKSPL